MNPNGERIIPLDMTNVEQVINAALRIKGADDLDLTDAVRAAMAKARAAGIEQPVLIVRERDGCWAVDVQEPLTFATTHP
jgi:hypothetical protein